MNKQTRILSTIITLLVWGVVVDMTIENEAPIWAAVLVSNVATAISTATILILADHATDEN